MLDSVGDSVAVRVTCREIQFRGSFDRGQEEGAGAKGAEQPVSRLT